MKRGFSFLATAASALFAGCTLVHVDTDDAPPRVESGGLIDGHLALGVREDDELLRVDLFDGRSPGALPVRVAGSVDLKVAFIEVSPFIHFGHGIRQPHSRHPAGRSDLRDLGRRGRRDPASQT